MKDDPWRFGFLVSLAHSRSVHSDLRICLEQWISLGDDDRPVLSLPITSDAEVDASINDLIRDLESVRRTAKAALRGHRAAA